MKTLILLNGEFTSAAFLKALADEFQYIICADGGYDRALKAGIRPDILLGDLDSIKQNTFEGETLKYPAEKNWTDCELAIETALERGASEICLSCALGGRADHEMANLLLLSRYDNVYIKEPSLSVYCCKDRLVLKNKVGKTISIIPTVSSVLSLSGFKYPLSKFEVTVGSTRGISNIAECDKAEIVVHSGSVLVFVNE